MCTIYFKEHLVFVSCFVHVPTGMEKPISLLLMHKAPDVSPMCVACFSNQISCRLPSYLAEERCSCVAFGGLHQSLKGLKVWGLLLLL